MEEKVVAVDEEDDAEAVEEEELEEDEVDMANRAERQASAWGR